MMNTFSERLQYVAGLKKIIQADIAKVLGTPPQTVNRWWSGERKPGGKYAAALAELFECEIKWLLNGDGEKPTKLQTFDMSGSGQYQVGDDIHGNMVMGNAEAKTTLQLTPLEKSVIELNRAMGSEENLKKWLREITES